VAVRVSAAAARRLAAQAGVGPPARPKAADSGTVADSPLVHSFRFWWATLDGPALETELRFDPRRRWRLDLADAASRVAVELDGGTWGDEASRGRHVRGAGYRNDCEKRNAATAAGWAVFNLTTDMLRDEPLEHLRPILETLRRRRRASRT
jgi:very-short-patch-repair endonuclease